jgi:hypothetical protein
MPIEGLAGYTFGIPRPAVFPPAATHLHIPFFPDLLILAIETTFYQHRSLLVSNFEL